MFDSIFIVCLVQSLEEKGEGSKTLVRLIYFSTN